MNIIDYVTFTRKPNQNGVIHEHAEVPTFTLAYYFECLLNPNHPEHAQVVRFAHEIQARAHEERLEHGRAMMRQTRANMTEEDWSLLVD